MLRDCDDAAALAVLLNLERAGRCEIAGMAVSSKHPYSSVAVNVINTYFGRSGILIGAPKNGRGVYRTDSCFLDRLAEEFPHALPCNDAAPNAIDVYRNVLSKADEKEIILVTIGYMTNVADLLRSGPDRWSELDGKTLIQRKVCRWICMGGNFPIDNATNNVNFTRDMPSAFEAISKWPSDLHFVGREIGHSIFAGDGLRFAPRDNPVRRAYELFHEMNTPGNWNHHTADPTTIWYAVHGCTDAFMLSRPGYIALDPSGEFCWVEDRQGKQRHLKQKLSRAQMAARLDRWISMSPMERK